MLSSLSSAQSCVVYGARRSIALSNSTAIPMPIHCYNSIRKRKQSNNKNVKPESGKDQRVALLSSSFFFFSYGTLKTWLGHQPTISVCVRHCRHCCFVEKARIGWRYIQSAPGSIIYEGPNIQIYAL